MNVLIDYLSLNIPIDSKTEIHKLNKIKKLLKLDFLPFDLNVMRSKSSKFIPKEQHKYTDSTSIFVNDSLSNDRYLTRIELKGEGCREFENRFGNDYQNAYSDLIKYVYENGGWATRFDIAIDTFNDYIKKEEIDKKINNSEYTSVFKKFRFDGTRNTADGSYDGWGYLFGTSNSTVVLRLYDKTAERISKGLEVKYPYWLRWEVRLMGSRAKAMSLELVENIGQLNLWGRKLLSSVIEFKTKNNDSNKARWNIWNKWNRLLGRVSKLELKNQAKLESTISTKKKWLNRSASRSDLMVELSEHKIENEISKKVYRYIGLSKFDYVSLNKVNERREQNNLELLKMEDIIKEKEELQYDLIECGFFDLIKDYIN